MYKRVVILLPQYKEMTERLEWLAAVMEAQAADMLTATFSADDAGNVSGCENFVIAVNPKTIGSGLEQSWFDLRYPGTIMIPVSADTPGVLNRILRDGIYGPRRELLVRPRFTEGRL